jgi:uncharacterized membrane protein
MLSQISNKDLMTQARETLTGKWGKVALATLVYVLAIAVVNLVPRYMPFIGGIICLLVSGPFILGYAAYMLSVSRGGDPDIPVIFSGFNNFLKAFLLYIIVVIITLVGFILLVVPGIIASLALCMVWFIQADNPQMGVTDIATASYNMTSGNLWKLFCFFLRFLGWAILCCFTFGIGFFFLLPYVQVSLAKFYEEIKGTEGVTPAHGG